MNSTICANCAAKRGGVWPGDTRAGFVCGNCDDCGGWFGVAPVSGWDWPRHVDDIDVGITAAQQ